MFFNFAAFDLSLVAQIARYVFFGTIALAAIVLLILLIFVCKRLKYKKQLRHNKREKEKIIKAYDQKIAKLEEQEAQKKAWQPFFVFSKKFLKTFVIFLYFFKIFLYTKSKGVFYD